MSVCLSLSLSLSVSVSMLCHMMNVSKLSRDHHKVNGESAEVKPGHYKVYLLPATNFQTLYGGVRKGQVFNVNLA